MSCLAKNNLSLSLSIYLYLYVSSSSVQAVFMVVAGLDISANISTWADDTLT